MEREQLDSLEERLRNRQNELYEYFSAHDVSIKRLESQELRDEIDYAAASMESFLGDTLIKHHKKEYDDIELALQKIEKGCYGICEMCQDEIDIERLQVKPHAKFCIVCREYIEKENNMGRKK